jgi:hypothetical protein
VQPSKLNPGEGLWEANSETGHSGRFLIYFYFLYSEPVNIFETKILERGVSFERDKVL